MKRPLSLLMLVAVCGCVRLSQPAPEIRDYRLDYPPPSVNGTPLPAVLAVPSLRVAAVYDREAIVYRQGANATGTYFYTRWSANPGNMVADLLARDFAESNLYRAVSRGPSSLPADYEVTGFIDEIEERVAPAGCAAHLQLRVLLARTTGSGNPVRLQRSYGGDEPCTCDRPAALAAAMSRVLERISTQLQQDVYDAVSKSNSHS
ncbi:MAG: ABC-type transport auxiliary lipoprotein family protein [Candidatus Binatia bacterium]